MLAVKFHEDNLSPQVQPTSSVGIRTAPDLPVSSGYLLIWNQRFLLAMPLFGTCHAKSSLNR